MRIKEAEANDPASKKVNKKFLKREIRGKENFFYGIVATLFEKKCSPNPSQKRGGDAAASEKVPAGMIMTVYLSL